MRTVKNLTSSPLRVPLPGGKTLHLAPNASAGIRDPAAEHVPLKKLVEAGTVEIGGGVSTSGDPAEGLGSDRGAAPRHNKSTARRLTADR